MLWPKVELQLQRDIAQATVTGYPDRWTILASGRKGYRKIHGAVPHDIGGPGEDP